MAISVRHFVAAVGSLSLLFFNKSRKPNPNEEPSISYQPRLRARDMRSLYNVDEDTSLLRDEKQLTVRDLRNHLEHYDERLDAWVAATSGHGIVMGGPARLANWPIPRLSKMEGFDPETLTVSFRDQTYALPAVADEVRDIYCRSTENGGEALYWDMESDPAVYKVLGSTVDRDAFDACVARYSRGPFPSDPRYADHMNPRTRAFRHFATSMDQTADRRADTCGACGGRLDFANGGRRCPQCRIWWPDTVFAARQPSAL
jgi:hypothetical protein